MKTTVKEALEKGIISNDTYNILPKTCKWCDNELKLNSSLERLSCDNKDCIGSLIKRAYRLCDKLKISLSNIDMHEIITSLNLISPYQLLIMDRAYDCGMLETIKSIELTDMIDDIRSIKHKEYEISDIASCCGIDNIEIIADKLFQGFSSFDEAYLEIEKAQIFYINERIGLSNINSSVYAISIYNQLMELREEFIFAESQLNIKRTHDRLSIAFGNNYKGFINKSEVIEKLNDFYKNKFNLVYTVDNNLDILIVEDDNDCIKKSIANNINNQYSAMLINNKSIGIRDVGKYMEGCIKPVGHSIYICTLKELIDRLREVG